MRCRDCKYWQTDGAQTLSGDKIGHCYCFRSEFVGTKTTECMTCKEQKNDLTAYIREKVSTAALFENMAEEAAELAHAAQKAARVIRGENPTPITLDMALSAFIEEFHDVVNVADVLKVQIDKDKCDSKIRRWAKRLGMEDVCDRD